jgi:phosphoribosylformylglycinamidine synthase I
MTMKPTTPRALVLRAPGINCDRETAHACRLVGFETDLVHINQLLKAPDTLLDYAFLVIPGGFSYGDDLGAGTLLAKNLTIHLGRQLKQFIAEGRPVLGICNGFQVLVRAGLLPESEDTDVRQQTPMRATLTDNESAQFECRWVTLATQMSRCIFTRGIERPIELPVAHGEGQFVFQGSIAYLQAARQIPLTYVTESTDDTTYPANPNGSLGNVAGVCNARGNVLGLMPHPERYVTALQHPLRRAGSNGQGDGLLIFKNAYAYVTTTESETETPASATHTSYAASGVDLDASDEAKRLMKDAVRSTQGSDVLAGMGAFAGIFNAQSVKQMRQPALVASTDGVGTKTVLAAQAKRFDTVGYDIVNHSVNDMLTQGAKPLFFMDYLAMSKLDPLQAATIVRGVATACQEVGCALLGGETAEMPDVYLPGAFDLAGTIVGTLEQAEAITGSTITPGDVLLGLPSSGLHTNGYSLARRVFASYDLQTIFPELDEPLIDALLRPHRCYLREITALRDYLGDRERSIKGMAHITGGGFEGNISRILPAGTRAIIETDKWSVPPLFALLAKLGNVTKEEQYRTLNMGIGMVIALSPKGALEARCILPELLTVGYVTEGEGVIIK